MLKRLRNHPLFIQLFYFGIVGVCASLVYLIILICLVSIIHMHPLIANIFAFLIGFTVSYSGHHHWTFASSNSLSKRALPRFFLIQTLGFCLNEGLFYIFLEKLKLHYIIAILITLAIVAFVTFLSSKLWAFRRQESHTNSQLG